MALQSVHTAVSRMASSNCKWMQVQQCADKNRQDGIHVLFLDVDGVLNVESSREDLNERLVKLLCTRVIARDTRLRLVLSSSWRLHPALFQKASLSTAQRDFVRRL